jgi:SAM-dependent methyltransferase
MKDRFRPHRKLWEFVYIAQALWENGLLVPGRRGLGFGCGLEPLPSLFAGFGCEILATDLDANDGRALGWAETDQNTLNSVENLNRLGLCPREQFEKLVKFQTLDMNHIPEELNGQFDFNWSACCVEHIGGRERSMDFLIENLRTLKPGGIAIHTSEFNLSSNEETCLDPNCFVFRRRDVEEVVERLSALGHEVFPMNYRIGDYVLDNYVDTPPFSLDTHLRLELQRFVSTSFGLIVRRAR